MNNTIDNTIAYLENEVLKKIDEKPWTSGVLERDGCMCLIGYLGVVLDKEGRNYVVPDPLVGDAVDSVSYVIRNRRGYQQEDWPIGVCYLYNDQHISRNINPREECRELIKETVDYLRTIKED